MYNILSTRTRYAVLFYGMLMGLFTPMKDIRRVKHDATENDRALNLFIKGAQLTMLFRIPFLIALVYMFYRLISLI